MDGSSMSRKFQFQGGNPSFPPGDFNLGEQGKALVLMLFTILLSFRQ